MIQAIIFDVGGVLIRTHDHTPRRELERRLGLDEWESEQLVFASEMGTKAQAGAITDATLWQWIGAHLDLDEAELKQFKRAFWAGDRLDADLVEYIRSLRPGYQTVIISNATDNLRHALTHVHEIADAFDLIVGSAEEKVMKPDPTIYRRTLARLGREPEEAVFIDDSPPNVAAARALGMHAIHFTPAVDLPDRLAQLGVTPRP